MGTGPSKPDAATEKLIAVSLRKCATTLSALQGCRKANTTNQETVCKNLEIKLISCWADDHCKEHADEHRRCYNKLYKTGMYKGLGHCIPYEEAMRNCLKKKGLCPS